MTTFSVGEVVCHPAHGAGEITDIETTEVAGMDVRVYVISYPTLALTARSPVTRKDLRRPSAKRSIPKVIASLREKRHPGHKSWERRARKLREDMKSGNILALAAVVRDTYRHDQELSFAENQIHEEAMEMLAREIGASTKKGTDAAYTEIITALAVPYQRKIRS